MAFRSQVPPHASPSPCSPGYAHMQTSQGWTCVPAQRGLAFGYVLSFPPYPEPPGAQPLSIAALCAELGKLIGMYGPDYTVAVRPWAYGHPTSSARFSAKAGDLYKMFCR